MNAAVIAEELAAAGAEMRACDARCAARHEMHERMAAAGYIRRADGFWMMPPGVGFGPAESIYAEHTGARTLD